MIRHAYLMHAAFHRPNIVVMTSLDMVQIKSIIFQNPDNIVESPVKNPLGHILHTSESVILDLNRRRNRFI